jgi:hypothetical protein
MTILPAQTSAGVLDITCMPRVAGLTGWRTACVITRRCRAPTLSEAGLIGGAWALRPAGMDKQDVGVFVVVPEAVGEDGARPVLERPIAVIKEA